MKFTRIVAISGIAVSLMGTGFEAQAQGTVAPREFPPVSYSGRQYVDNSGCAFIRAGIDGAVQWVPRVTRERKQICGLKPTVIARSAAPQPTSRNAAVINVTAGAAPASRTNARPVPLRRAEPGLARTVVTPENAASKGVSQTTRLLPKHVYENRKNSLNVSVPKGYRTVWQDDRLNPRRAEQTLAGRARMNQIWTRKTPRRLVD